MPKASAPGFLDHQIDDRIAYPGLFQLNQVLWVGCKAGFAGPDFGQDYLFGEPRPLHLNDIGIGQKTRPGLAVRRVCRGTGRAAAQLPLIDVHVAAHKAFARSVNRQDITEGAQELGVPLEEHVEFCIKAMQERASELGLAGTSAGAG
jgi:hypothetical protein